MIVDWYPKCDNQWLVNGHGIKCLTGVMIIDLSEGLDDRNDKGIDNQSVKISPNCEPYTRS